MKMIKSKRFYKATCSFNNLCNRYSFDLFAVDTFCHKSCYIKYTINLIGKSDKTHNYKEDRSKYLIHEALEKFNRTKSKSIIRNWKVDFTLVTWPLRGCLYEKQDEIKSRTGRDRTISMPPSSKKQKSCCTFF